MARVAFRPICLLVALALQLSPAVPQSVPSNYLPLDTATPAMGVRASTYPTEPVHEATPAQEPENDTEQEAASNLPLDTVNVSSGGITMPEGAIVALGSDPRNPSAMRAYTSKNYPGVSRGAVQSVRDTQAQYAESLASEDVMNILGRPFSEITHGHGQCADGQSGDVTMFYYLIREGVSPKSMAVVRFCADGMQSITTQSLR